MGLPIPIDDHIELPTVEAEVGSELTAAETKRPRPSGAHVTLGNARLLAFIGTFAGADAEALSMLSNRQETRFAPGGELTTVKGTETRLSKLARLGAVEKYRNQQTRTTQFGITKAGIAAAFSYGYSTDNAETIRNLAIKRLTHYRMIAHVAAQFMSPAGYFRESLGVEPVDLDQLVNERTMRIASDPVKKLLQKDTSSEHHGDFGRWRAGLLESAKSAAAEGRLRWSDLVDSRPALLTMGAPQRADSVRKPIHEPDLVVKLDGSRTDARAKNIAVEIELSKKSWPEYDSILATWAAEFESGLVYDFGVYMTPSKQIASLLKRVDETGGYDLIRSGKLRILPLLHRDRTLYTFDNRVKIGGR